MRRTGILTRRDVLSFLFVLFAGDIVPTSNAIWINMPETGMMKCISEEIQNNVVVLGDYVVIADDPTINPTISVKATSPYGNILHHSQNTTHGHFAFTSTEDGSYVACFWLDAPHPQTGEISVNLDWKTGIAAKDWDSVARREKIEGVELELRKLEGAVEQIHDTLLNLKGREEGMRMVSEKTNARVAWFSIMSLGVCILVSGFQVWHLKRYFQKKRII